MKISHKHVYIFLISLFFIFITLDAVLAQAAEVAGCPSGGLIPCGGPDCPCTLCHFFVMIERIVNFLLTRAVPVIAGLMVVAAGVMMVLAHTGQAGPELVAKSKKLLKAVAIGLVIVYLAWGLTNLFLMSINVVEWTGLRTWWVVNCPEPQGGEIPSPSDPLDLNNAPVFNDIPNVAAGEGQPLTFSVFATDVDNDVLSYSVQNLPVGANFKDNTFSWTPFYGQTGTYNLTFIVSDGKLTDSRVVAIAVGDACLPVSCLAQKKNCGTVSDGCGGTLNCGTCTSGYVCESGVCMPTNLICGDSSCDGSETCSTCPQDCGVCPVLPDCGDGSCNGTENCSTCPQDCGACPVAFVCGDGSCNSTENCSSCPQDCGACPVVTVCDYEIHVGESVDKYSNVATAGQTVCYRGGVHSGRLIPVNSGSAGKYITYTSYPGEHAVLDGTNVSLKLWEGLVHIVGRSYIKISGLSIQNVYNNIDKYEKTYGIRVSSSSNVIIDNSYFYNTCGPAIQTGGSSNIIVDNNEFELNCHDCRGEIVSIASTNTFEVKNNYIHDGGLGYGRYSFGGDGGEGIDAKEGSANGKIYNNIIHTLIEDMGIYVDTYGYTKNIEIYNNKIYNSREGITLGTESSHPLDNIKIHNNLVYNNSKYGYNICGNGQGAISNVSVLNNVAYNNVMGGVYACERGYSNIVIKNNILSQNRDFQLRVTDADYLSVFDISNNIIDGFRGYLNEIHDENDIFLSPKFINPSAGDFRLRDDSSPAVNAGLNVGLTKDFLGNTIPYSGTIPDIGAYEYGY